MKRRLEIEALEDRRLLTATLSPLPPVSAGSQKPAVVATASAPGSALNIVTPAQPSVSTTVPTVGGFRVNHNETLLRVRRLRGRGQ